MQGTPRVMLRDYRPRFRWAFCRHYATAKPAQRRYAHLPRSSQCRCSLNIFPSDFLTLSHRKTFCVSFTHPGPWGTGPGCAELAYQYTNAGVKPFPPHARDFLYSPDALAAGRGRPSAHHLRQRRPPRPKTYACLRECRGKSASPRSRPQKFSRLREQLLRAGMAPKAFISRCRAIFGNRRNIHPELTVWGLQHPFLVNLGTSLCLTIVGPAAAHETELQPLTEWILR